MASDTSPPTCVVTGASSGIGLETAKALAASGARVIAVARTERSAAAAAAEVPSDVRWLHADFSVLGQVRALAQTILDTEPNLNVLINNAGGTSKERRLTAEGVEQTLAVNHMAPFLLTNLLLPRLRENAPSRVITVASSTHEVGELDFDDLTLARRYRQFSAYARSKLANVLFSGELARRLDGSGVTANAVHPGLARTHLGDRNGTVRKLAWEVIHLRYRNESLTAEEAAAPVVRLALSPEVADVSGEYFAGEAPAASSPASQDPQTARKLWELSERMTGAVAA